MKKIVMLLLLSINTATWTMEKPPETDTINTQDQLGGDTGEPKLPDLNAQELEANTQPVSKTPIRDRVLKKIGLKKSKNTAQTQAPTVGGDVGADPDGQAMQEQNNTALNEELEGRRALTARISDDGNKIEYTRSSQNPRSSLQRIRDELNYHFRGGEDYRKMKALQKITDSNTSNFTSEKINTKIKEKAARLDNPFVKSRYRREANRNNIPVTIDRKTVAKTGFGQDRTESQQQSYDRIKEMNNQSMDLLDKDDKDRAQPVLKQKAQSAISPSTEPASITDHTTESPESTKTQFAKGVPIEKRNDIFPDINAPLTEPTYQPKTISDIFNTIGGNTPVGPLQPAPEPVPNITISDESTEAPESTETPALDPNLLQVSRSKFASKIEPEPEIDLTKDSRNLIEQERTLERWILRYTGENQSEVKKKIADKIRSIHVELTKRTRERLAELNKKATQRQQEPEPAEESTWGDWFNKQAGNAGSYIPSKGDAANLAGNTLMHVGDAVNYADPRNWNLYNHPDVNLSDERTE
jgi:hypothetical protein